MNGVNRFIDFVQGTKKKKKKKKKKIVEELFQWFMWYIILMKYFANCDPNSLAIFFKVTNVLTTVARERYLARSLHSYTINDLLHGKYNLSLHENEILTLQVQDFIIKSERFVKVPSI